MAAPYASLAEFKAWSSWPADSDDDPAITDALTAASAAIDNFCSTHFWQTTAGTTRVFDTCDPRKLRINDAAAVTGVATDKDSDGTFETVWDPADFQLLPLNPAAAPEVLPFTAIRAVATKTFPAPTKREGIIRVTGTWGWAAIPESVVQATLLVANRLLKRRQSPEGIAGLDDFGTIRISNREDPDAVRLVTPYRTNRRVGGWAFA